MNGNEKIREILYSIGHLSAQIEHFLEFTYNHNELVSDLRAIRIELAKDLLTELSHEYKIEYNNLQDMWCYIKHHCIALVHLTELAEKYSSESNNMKFEKTIEQISKLNNNLFKHIMLSVSPHKPCNGCSGEVKIIKLDDSLEDKLK